METPDDLFSVAPWPQRQDEQVSALIERLNAIEERLARIEQAILALKD